jgi:hypothetical protein
MSFLTSPISFASWADRPLVYFCLAGLALLVVLRFAKRALAPVGAMIQAVAAAAIVAFALVMGAALVAVGLLSGH